uniref:Uncharacterized protein n=1 Tax=Bionectria ochroleuca TaxID=29856 RepID=A0A8H7NMS6_BIOOC
MHRALSLLILCDNCFDERGNFFPHSKPKGYDDIAEPHDQQEDTGTWCRPISTDDFQSYDASGEKKARVKYLENIAPDVSTLTSDAIIGYWRRSHRPAMDIVIKEVANTHRRQTPTSRIAKSSASRRQSNGTAAKRKSNGVKKEESDSDTPIAKRGNAAPAAKKGKAAAASKKEKREASDGEEESTNSGIRRSPRTIASSGKHSSTTAFSLLLSTNPYLKTSRCSTMEVLSLSV